MDLSSESPDSLCEVCHIIAAVRVVNSLSGAPDVPLPAEFTLGRKSPRSLFSRPYFGPCKFLSFAAEALVGQAAASATGAFSTTLAAIGFSFVRISFARPLVLGHGATGARRQRGCCNNVVFLHNPLGLIHTLLVR